jgi:hypothetical protein
LDAVGDNASEDGAIGVSEKRDQSILAKKRAKNGGIRDGAQIGVAHPQESDETTVLPFAYRYQLVLLSELDGT